MVTYAECCEDLRDMVSKAGTPEWHEAFLKYQESSALFKAKRKTPSQKKNEEETQLKKLIKRIMEEETKRLKRKALTKKEMQQAAKRITKTIREKLEKQYGRFVDHVYKEAFKAAAKELSKQEGIKLEFGGPHKEAIKTAVSGEAAAKSFAGMSRSMSERFNDIITESFKRATPDPVKTADEMYRAAKEKYAGRVFTIARTETHKIWETARANTYEQAEEMQGEKFLYSLVRHLGPTPLGNPQCKICTHVIKETKDGVTMDELKRIMIEASQNPSLGGSPKWNPTRDSLFPVLHPNCRHRHVRNIAAEDRRDGFA